MSFRTCNITQQLIKTETIRQHDRLM